MNNTLQDIVSKNNNKKGVPTTERLGGIYDYFLRLHYLKYKVTRVSLSCASLRRIGAVAS